MKKSYITPQTIMVCGAYNTQILAGSGESTGSGGSEHGEGGEGGNNTSETIKPGSGVGGTTAKQNAWESWD